MIIIYPLFFTLWDHSVHQLKTIIDRRLSDPRFLEASFSWYRRGTNATVRKSRGTSDLTFGFVVGKLVVGEAKPSLLEVLHPEPVSPLRSLYHESERKMGEKNITYCKTLTDELIFRRNV